MQHAKTQIREGQTEAARFEALLRLNLQNVCQLSGKQVELLYSHYRLLDRWNRVLNLSSIRDLEKAVVRHYCESIFLAVKLPERIGSVADLGSGGGFPGIPIAVLRPDCQVALIESHQRKAVFLKEATRGYGNVRIIAKRGEQIQEQFDWLVSRAVAWEQVVRLALLLASNLALLVGAADALKLLKIKTLSWLNPISLPWGRQQNLIIGHIVPRETC